jgi:hypothetical protein
MSIESLVRHLSAVGDPRCQGKIEHRLTLQLRSERSRNFEAVLVGREAGLRPWMRGPSRGQVR